MLGAGGEVWSQFYTSLPGIAWHIPKRGLVTKDPSELIPKHNWNQRMCVMLKESLPLEAG